ncbi:MAG: T9SS type A sorting domain-containing protein [Bacteroidales bacterium]|nr:T9SS type A sorting domain-containing protein [Bacteroidales bacterium]
MMIRKTTILTYLLLANIIVQAASPFMPISSADSLLRAERQSYVSIMPLAGNLNQPPNPGSIHVNRDTAIRQYTPTQLVERIFVRGGSSSSVSNVTLRSHGWDEATQTWTDNDNRGLGHFTRGTSDFEFESGLVLSTGGLVSIEGPNQFDNGVGLPPITAPEGDADLQILVGNVTNVSVLEFDFVPTSNVIQFRYVFASEEYLSFVNSAFNDVFGFFISGPGISGNFTNNGVNIATLPTTTSGTDIVSINNVNWGTRSFSTHNCAVPTDLGAVNPNYYINIPGSWFQTGCPMSASDSTLFRSMEFNGRTVVLTATVNVIPCSTYRIRLAIGNAGDQSFQSGVFLEAHSFDFGDNIVNFGNNIEGLDNVFRGCVDNKLVISRGGSDNSTPLTVALTYSGTAINGVDISLPGGGALPNSVTIPAGQDTVQIHYTVNTSPADSATFIISSDCICGGEVFSRTIHIHDPADFEVTAFSSCPGTNSGRILINVVSGTSGTYESSIDGGVTWQPHIEHTGLAPGNYEVHVRDIGSCHNNVHNVTVGVFTANAGSNHQSLCTNVFIMDAAPLLSGETGTWSVVFGTASIANPSNPTTNVTVSGSSAMLVWTLNSLGCQATDTVRLIVRPTFDLEETLTIFSDELPYTWRDTTFLESGTFVFNRTTIHGCDSIVHLHLTVLPATELNPISIICRDDTSFTLSYTMFSNTPPLFQSVFFDERARAAGFNDIIRETVNTFSINIPLPVGVRPDTYRGTLILEGNLHREREFDFEFSIRYSSSIIIQMWNDVLALSNSVPIEEGCRLSNFQWYKNNQPIWGATGSYLYVGPHQTLDIHAEYKVSFTRCAETVAVYTCPIIPVLRYARAEFPTLVEVSQTFNMLMPTAGYVEIHDLIGRRISRQAVVEGTNSIVAPNFAGAYVLTIYSKTGGNIVRERIIVR